MSIIAIGAVKACGNICNPFVTITNLFRAIRSRDVDSVESNLNLIKSSSHLAMILNATSLNTVLQSNQTPLLTVLNQTRESREEFEVDFRIAGKLIEAHKECNVGILSHELLDTLQFLEKELGSNPLNSLNPEDLSIAQKLHSAFLDNLTEILILLDNSSIKTRVERLNELLIYAIENGMPKLTKILLEKGADHTLLRNKKSLLQRAVDMQRENGLGHSSVYELVHKVLWETQAERFTNVGDAVRSQFSRLGLVFAWNKGREKLTSKAHIGLLPKELMVKIGRHLSWDLMNWPFKPLLDSHISLVRASWANDAETRKRKPEALPADEPSNAQNTPRRRSS